MARIEMPQSPGEHAPEKRSSVVPTRRFEASARRPEGERIDLERLKSLRDALAGEASPAAARPLRTETDVPAAAEALEPETEARETEVQVEATTPKKSLFKRWLIGVGSGAALIGAGFLAGNGGGGKTESAKKSDEDAKKKPSAVVSAPVTNTGSSISFSNPAVAKTNKPEEVSFANPTGTNMYRHTGGFSTNTSLEALHVNDAAGTTVEAKKTAPPTVANPPEPIKVQTPSSMAGILQPPVMPGSTARVQGAQPEALKADPSQAKKPDSRLKKLGKEFFGLFQQGPAYPDQRFEKRPPPQEQVSVTFSAKRGKTVRRDIIH